MARHGSTEIETLARSCGAQQGRFGRMFHLPAFAADTPQVRNALMSIGKPEGIMDAQDKGDPVSLITDPALSKNNPDNPKMTAGMTFLGQFLDHDITFDPTSSLERQQDPESIVNFRTPSLELDSVYGAGPGGSPHLYDQANPVSRLRGITFYVEKNEASALVSRDGLPRFDLPRNGQGTALLGDPRNDENVILSQLHVGFLKFHNAVAEHMLPSLSGGHPVDFFAAVQRQVRWHYQWIVLHEFLPLTVGGEVVQDVLEKGRRFYHWKHAPYIPVEHSVAAYRFGHSQVRPSYRANFDPKNERKPFFAMIFDRSLTPSNDPDDLRGGTRAGRRFIDWETFFNFGDGQFRNNKKIDTTLSTPLTGLLGQPDHEPQSLAQRNLLRALALKVPSGQAVARAMCIEPLDPSELSDLTEFGLHEETPLWFYILREAEKRADGMRLGPVGGRIVAEVFIGLLQGDPLSFLSVHPKWKPTLGPTPGEFTMADLLTFAGVGPR